MVPILQHLSWIIRNTPSFSFLMNFRGVLAKDHLFLTHPVVSIIIHIFACAQVPTRSLPVHIKHPGHRCSGYQYNEEELGSLQLSMRRKQEEIFQIERPFWNKHNPIHTVIKQKYRTHFQFDFVKCQVQRHQHQLNIPWNLKLRDENINQIFG